LYQQHMAQAEHLEVAGNTYGSEHAKAYAEQLLKESHDRAVQHALTHGLPIPPFPQVDQPPGGAGGVMQKKEVKAEATESFSVGVATAIEKALNAAPGEGEIVPPQAPQPIQVSPRGVEVSLRQAEAAGKSMRKDILAKKKVAARSRSRSPTRVRGSPERSPEGKSLVEELREELGAGPGTPEPIVESPSPSPASSPVPQDPRFTVAPASPPPQYPGAKVVQQQTPQYQALAQPQQGNTQFQAVGSPAQQGVSPLQGQLSTVMGLPPPSNENEARLDSQIAEYLALRKQGQSNVATAVFGGPLTPRSEAPGTQPVAPQVSVAQSANPQFSQPSNSQPNTPRSVQLSFADQIDGLQANLEGRS